MPRVKYTTDDVDLLARMIRAEAEGEGEQGMLMVGNVGVNRIVCNCLDFKDIRTVHQMVYQIQGGNYSFECVEKGYFYQRARSQEKRLAKKNLDYYRLYPATYSLWYFNPPGEAGQCPPQWYDQKLVDGFKNHCFYQPSQQDCPNVFNG
ncbi:cell wall hydrolase [Neobacillus massiliamazoniensis]|jgi:N-acetylmuramoyl-L-alanine amidase|uniref:Cell wall hydrolase CwlJ n=1 Tax=Neobacillus massiliamazoniensis TaxID=1499688 RepID=A0A0U1NYY0_9BACI|nr:cell wall hydrolase [Neobacillus massiliamazoniensis]CRK83240.1 cell wall hydrolase CwlJ [Neobacillus massiliamazoniensis]